MAAWWEFMNEAYLGQKVMVDGGGLEKCYRGQTPVDFSVTFTLRVVSCRWRGFSLLPVFISSVSCSYSPLLFVLQPSRTLAPLVSNAFQLGAEGVAVSICV